MKNLNQATSAATKLPWRERMELALKALRGPESVTGLAAEHGVSRKFAYAQAELAIVALDEAIAPAANDGQRVLFGLPVPHEMIVALELICRSSYRGVVE